MLTAVNNQNNKQTASGDASSLDDQDGVITQYLIKHHGPTMSLNEVAEVMKYSTQSVKLAIKQKDPDKDEWARAVQAALLPQMKGRRVFRTITIGRFLDQ